MAAAPPVADVCARARESGNAAAVPASAAPPKRWRRLMVMGMLLMCGPPVGMGASFASELGRACANATFGEVMLRKRSRAPARPAIRVPRHTGPLARPVLRVDGRPGAPCARIR